MPIDRQYPVIAFLWRSGDIKSAVIEAARNTRTRAIFDLRRVDFDAAASAFLRADPAPDCADIRISPERIIDKTLEDFLEETGIGAIWTEIHPVLLDVPVASCLRRLEELSATSRCFPVVGDINLIRLILSQHPGIRNIVLKGSEASGFVSAETVLTLYCAVRNMIRGNAQPPNILIWGGIATPEAAAAFLSAGVNGIVFESLHWLTDLVALDGTAKDKISKILPEHTNLAGSSFQVPCRLFNKGNSLAVKKLMRFTGSLCGGEITDEHRRSFAAKVRLDAVDPLESSFSREELVPLGIEAAFALSFVRRFGSSTEGAIDRFVDRVQEICSLAADKEKAFLDGPVAAEIGSRYALIQGAMSWITDVPEFALKVAQAGALPTIALGLIPGSILDEKLGRLRETMGDLPYAVNVVTLQENPHRDEQLAWIRELKPRFAVIAAGDPSYARELIQSGIDTIYIAPNEQLLKLAFEAGVRYVICEGNEAGGHVGEHSTVTLAQILLDKRDRDPALFKGRRVILAGGICNRESAFLAAMLGADAIQIGTAYLTTREIVDTGALPDLYRRMVLESAAGSTVVTGEAIGLKVRSLKTPKIETFCSLERDYAFGSNDEATFRKSIEQLSAGSLFIAARGLDKPDGSPLDEHACVKQGQFMCGACGGVLDKVRTVEQLHVDLAEADLGQALPFLGPIREPRAAGRRLDATETTGPVPLPRSTYRTPARERIAITGMSIVNSLGNTPEEVWAASVAMKSGVVPVPPSKWNHEIFYDPRPRAPEKTYCKIAAFQNIEISRKDLGISPHDFRTMTASTKITMWLARQAIEASGILSSDIPRERIGVLISQNSGEAAATLEDVIIRGAVDKIVESVKGVIPLTPDKAAEVKEAVKFGRMAIDDTTLLGRLNCTAGGFICNKYGFMGPSFAVSAACATALVALYTAYQMIRNGIIDAAVIGGAEEPLTPMHFLEFSALGALAGLSGVDRAPHEASRPFDADRDGMVLGEGGGMIVIERESLARARGAHIYAYITGMGASNNHLGMVESSSFTQEIAIRSSFEDVPYGPDEVDLVECHATSTIQGDAEEVRALKRFYHPDSPTVLAAFKSQIAHTLGSSGVNSLIRGIMAMTARTFPPNLNYDSPDAAMGPESSGLRISSQPEPWEAANGLPRRFQLDAFGFGGSNYVLQVEEALESRDTVFVLPPDAEIDSTASVRSISLPDGVHFFKPLFRGKPWKVALLAESRDLAVSNLQSVESSLRVGKLSKKDLRSFAKQGVYLSPDNEHPSPVALVFPGQGSHYQGMGRELYESFPVIREWLDTAASVADFDLLQLMFYDSEEDLQKTRWQQPALFALEFALVRQLTLLGVEPVALAGHSLGELTALCLAGVYSFEDGFRIVNKRAMCMDKACVMHVDPGVMMAVDAPLSLIEERLPALPGVYITNINSPHQVVIGGDTSAVQAFGEELKARGYRRKLLRVSMAFHSPIMACIHDELEEFIAGIEFHPPEIPVVSNTTREPFPSDTGEIRRIVMAHLESPVHWMENVRTLWETFGVRHFVEVGPGDILTNLILDTQAEADCIQSCLPPEETRSFKTAMTQLYVKGYLDDSIVRPEPWQPPRSDANAAQSHRGMVASSPDRSRLVSTGVDPVLMNRISALVRDGFDRLLKPGLLEMVRQDYDPQFTEEKLATALRALYPGLLDQRFPGPGSPAGISANPNTAVRGAASTRPDQPVAENTDEMTETVIQVIMEATGYERDEIAPGMDLREDLSIRSSRLPVIMDNIETRFGIKIHLEDFMEVRTVEHVAERLREIVLRDGSNASRRGPSVEVAAPIRTDVGQDTDREEQAPIKRILFREVPLKTDLGSPIEVAPNESIVMLSLAECGLIEQTAGFFRSDFGAQIVPLELLTDPEHAKADGFDLRSLEGAQRAADRISQIESPTGLVFVADHLLASAVKDPDEAADLFRGIFVVLKAFLHSRTKKFALFVHKEHQPNSTGSLVAEGVLGMFLTLAHEFASVKFRTVRIDEEADAGHAIRTALGKDQKIVEIIYRDGGVFSVKGAAVPCAFSETDGLSILPEDVVVIAGGGSGITHHLARSLVPLGCRMVFLGRTGFDPDIDYRQMLSDESNSPDALERAVEKAKPGLSGAELRTAAVKAAKAVEIIKHIEELRALGIEASYYRCDVADREMTLSVMSEIARRYGRINGILHGAGILRDSFARQMSAEDFTTVMDVKLRGAWNLFTAAQNQGLKFFVCLSSAAAIQGNPGQVNYSAANRAMSALVRQLSEIRRSIRFKALHLPPVEGLGMAEDPEIRALMKRINAGYVHVDELAELFARELHAGSARDTPVLFMRSLPDLDSVLLDGSEATVSPGELYAGPLAFRREDFPMIDSVTNVDLRNCELKAARSFSHEKDRWLPDHKPFRFLRYPLVSAIMAVETLLESATLLYPHLRVKAVRDVEFMEILECPPDRQRSSEILCRRIGSEGPEVVCESVLATREISPSGRELDQMTANFRARLVFGSEQELAAPVLSRFPVQKEELDSSPVNRAQVLKWYEDRSHMQGRYRLIEEMDGSGPDSVRGRFVYREGDDFAPPRRTVYRYSPYLLEALMQVAIFFAVMRDEKEDRTMIPQSIGEILFFRKCRNGESVVVEGRMIGKNDEGLTWEARGLDERGNNLMLVRRMLLRCFSG